MVTRLRRPLVSLAHLLVGGAIVVAFTAVWPGAAQAADPLGSFSEYSVPTAASAPLGIAGGPGGNVWFTEQDANKVAKGTTSGVFTEYLVPTASSPPLELVVGPDGNVWFTEAAGNEVAKVTTAGVFSEFPVPTASSTPAGIALGPDGNL